MRRIAHLAVVLALALASGTARAQAGALKRNGETVCLRFSFGTWKPALDWRAAGHGDFPDTSKLQRAAPGRDWAIDSGERDSSLILFPAWWPVGVLVRLPKAAPAMGDTVSGDAIALRANVDTLPPRTRVRAWRVACGA